MAKNRSRGHPNHTSRLEWTWFWNPAKTNDAVGPEIYENEYGFVPHNYACFSVEGHIKGGKFCDKFSQYAGEHNWWVKDGTPGGGRGPIVCNCNNGECKWNDKEGQGQS